MHADVDGFLAHLQVERRMSVHTLDAYRRDLGALVDWTGAQARGDLRGLQGDDIRAFVAAGHRGGLSPKSLQRRLSACRSFYQWLLKHGHIVANPAAGVRGPKAPRNLPQVLDVDEASLIIVDLQGKVLEGRKKPFSELELHLAAYRARPFRVSNL